MTDDWRPEEPIFTRHRDDQGHETVMVDRWPRQIEVDEVFLSRSSQDHVQIDGDTLTFTVTNGRAVYQIVERSLILMTAKAQRVSSRLQS